MEEARACFRGFRKRKETFVRMFSRLEKTGVCLLFGVSRVTQCNCLCFFVPLCGFSFLCVEVLVLRGKFGPLQPANLGGFRKTATHPNLRTGVRTPTPACRPGLGFGFGFKNHSDPRSGVGVRKNLNSNLRNRELGLQLLQGARTSAYMRTCSELEPPCSFWLQLSEYDWMPHIII